MRPIDADALREDLRDSYNELRKIYDKLTCEDDRNICGGELSTLLEVLMRIKKAPALDVAPVVYGRWVRIKTPYDIYYNYECSNCGCGINNSVRSLYFCPRCGANMICGRCEHSTTDRSICKGCGAAKHFCLFKEKKVNELRKTTQGV